MERNPLLRVVQMNTIYFDKEIVKLFLEQLKSSLKYLQPGYSSPYNDELNFALRLLLLGYSLYKCDSTFGQKLLSIKYENITALKKVLILTELLVEYLMEKLERINNKPFDNHSLAKFKGIMYLCSLVNISIFLRNGKKPRLIERILDLDLKSSQDFQRQFNSHYMTRELLWDSFIEMLIYALPLINYYKMRRFLKSLNPFYKKLDYLEAVNPAITLDTKCAHCNEFPVLPHHMGCVHIFCYTCLKGNQIADPKYECPHCRYTSVGSLCRKVESNKL